ncbi:MAG: hypothetical protein RLZZ142_2700 [Verrucomicrobiota bacterium]
MVGPEKAAHEVGDDEAHKSDGPAGCDGGGREEGGEQQQLDARGSDGESEVMGGFLPETEQIEGLGKAQRAQESEEGVRPEKVHVGPVSVSEASHEPCERGAHLKKVGAEEQEGGEGLGDGSDCHAAQEKGGQGSGLVARGHP